MLTCKFNLVQDAELSTLGDVKISSLELMALGSCEAELSRERLKARLSVGSTSEIASEMYKGLNS